MHKYLVTAVTGNLQSAIIQTVNVKLSGTVRHPFKADTNTVVYQ